MSVGQVIELDIVGEIDHERRLDDTSDVASDTASTNSTDSDAAAPANPEIKTAEAQEPTKEDHKIDHSKGDHHISAGTNIAHDTAAPISSHAVKVGTPGDRFLFTESPVEYYYYHNPVVKKVQPTQGLTTGGTPIEVSGAWFDEKLEYGVIPYCKIGDKIVRAQYFSTVRIVCYSPPNDNLAVALPVGVSLNGVDFVDTGFFFSYYTQPELLGLSPASGPYQGGTEVMVKGNLFSNITDQGMVKCRFTFKNGTDGWRQTLPKSMPAFYIDAHTMMCLSPNGFLGGDKVYI